MYFCVLQAAVSLLTSPVMYCGNKLMSPASFLMFKIGIRTCCQTSMKKIKAKRNINCHFYMSKNVLIIIFNFRLSVIVLTEKEKRKRLFLTQICVDPTCTAECATLSTFDIEKWAEISRSQPELRVFPGTPVSSVIKIVSQLISSN